MKLVYIGNMSRSYDLATVIAAAIRADGVELDLAGTGPDEPRLRALAADSPRIRFHGYLAAAPLAALVDAADAGVVPMFADSFVAVPGKLCEYLRAGKPVVNSLPGETAELLARSEAGVFYTAGDVESFLSALRDLENLSRSPHYSSRPLPPQALFEAEFSAAKTYPAYVRFCEDLV